MRAILERWHRFAGDHKGLVFVEFAFVVPVLALMLLGVVDVGRYFLAHQKMQRTASTVADLVAQDDSLSVAEVQEIITASRFVMTPFVLGENGVVTVSSVSANEDGDTVINWQQSGGGTLAETSRVGTAGGAATMPGTFVVPDEQTVIVAEVWYVGGGFFVETFASKPTYYHTAIIRPRGVGSTELTSGSDGSG